VNKQDLAGSMTSIIRALTFKNMKLIARDPVSAARYYFSRPAQAELNALRYRVSELEGRLAEYDVVRSIHLHDMDEMEELIRLVALPDLPRREGRAHDLSILMGTTVCEAFYMIDALHKALKATEGAVCEFGVAQGATSRLLAQEIRASDRRLYLFDSFEGLPKPTSKDRLIHDMFNLGSMDAYTGTMRRPESEVLSKLADINFPMDRVEVMKGWANETLAGPRAPAKIAFAYIDFDLYEPIRDTLAYVDVHSTAGARVVVDDYGFFSEGVQLATDEFVAASRGRWIAQKPLAFAGHFITLERK
jgi:O-methyltransferase